MEGFKVDVPALCIINRTCCHFATEHSRSIYPCTTHTYMLVYARTMWNRLQTKMVHPNLYRNLTKPTFGYFWLPHLSRSFVVKYVNIIRWAWTTYQMKPTKNMFFVIFCGKSVRILEKKIGKLLSSPMRIPRIIPKIFFHILIVGSRATKTHV